MDVKKLEKQEAKIRAKIDKRSKRSMYEGSKLLDQQKKQVRMVTCDKLTATGLTLVLRSAIVRGDVHEGSSNSFA